MAQHIAHSMCTINDIRQLSESLLSTYFAPSLGLDILPFYLRITTAQGHETGLMLEEEPELWFPDAQTLTITPQPSCGPGFQGKGSESHEPREDPDDSR